MLHTSSALVLLLFLFAAPTAHAQETSTSEGAELETEARARFSLGQLYYSQARFAEAAAEFEAAYATHPHPLLLYNIYLARRDHGDLRAAVEALTHYLADATDLSAPDRRLLEGRLAAMRGPLEVTPPAPDPVVGSAAPLTAGDELADPSDAPPPPPPPSDDGSMTGAIVSFSVAGAAVLMMAITGPLALVERDHLAGTCAPTCSDAQVAGASSLGIATDVGLGIASAGVLAGVVLAVMASMNASSGPVAIAPSISADHAALFVEGRF